VLKNEWKTIDKYRENEFIYVTRVSVSLLRCVPIEDDARFTWVPGFIGFVGLDRVSNRASRIDCFKLYSLENRRVSKTPKKTIIRKLIFTHLVWDVWRNVGIWFLLLFEILILVSLIENFVVEKIVRAILRFSINVLVVNRPYLLSWFRFLYCLNERESRTKKLIEVNCLF